MEFLKRIYLFVNRQWGQIQAGGVSALFRKTKRAWKLLFMNISAPVAVVMKMNWPEAYDFVGKQVFKKVKRLYLKPISDRKMIFKLMKKSIDCLHKAVDTDPDISNIDDWVKTNMLLESLQSFNGDMDACNAIYKRVAAVQCSLQKKHQLDSLGIEFLPCVLPLGSIGVYENLEVYIKAGMLGLRPNKKMILLLPAEDKVVNPCYLKYWNRYISVVTDPVLVKALSSLEKILTAQMISFMPLHGQISKSCLTLGKIREQWLKEDKPPLLKLTSEDHERGWRSLRPIGIPKDAWFVCLHVRESGTKDNGSPAEGFRNADIKTYFPAIKTVTDAGGWVIRIGDPGMTRLPAMPQVIDYAHSNAKSDWMDIFLCAQCRFMIGTASGMYTISMAFGVPVAMTNLLPARAMYFLSSDVLFIPRLCWSNTKERYLSFKELLLPPVGMTSSQLYFDDMNIQVIENTADEIKELVEEMLEKCDGSITYNDQNEEAVRKFIAITSECGKYYGEGDIAVHARIGKKFLRKHAALLLSEMEIKSDLNGKKRIYHAA